MNEREVYLLWSWLENSTAFCRFIRGRDNLDDDDEELVVVVNVDVVVELDVDVDCNEFSKSNCCTCVISTYSSKLFVPEVLVFERGALNMKNYFSLFFGHFCVETKYYKVL